MRVMLPVLCLLAALALWQQAPAATADLFPEKLVDAHGKAVSRDVLKGKIVGVYFSAEWCPPCRAFTPSLVAFRDKHKDEFEVVFVSSDRSADDQKKYMSGYKMAFPAVPHGSAAGNALKEQFSVRGIPKLVILDANGKVISENGRGDIGSDQAGALAKWKQKSS